MTTLHLLPGAHEASPSLRLALARQLQLWRERLAQHVRRGAAALDRHEPSLELRARHY
jgi:hypothetical protein